VTANSPLRILLLEDDITDAELVCELLEQDHFGCDVTRVQTRSEFVAALRCKTIDLILADYKLPTFDGLSALNLVLKDCPDLPFIFVSGTLGEEVAVEALKIGATDYVLKTGLSRLVPAVRRALREAEEKSERKKAQEALLRAEEAARRSESELRDLVENIPAMVFIALPGPSNAFVSRGWRQYTGLSEEHTAGFGWRSVVHPDDLERHMEKWGVCWAGGEPLEDEVRFRREADQEYRWFLVRAVPVCDQSGDVLKCYGVLADIEDRVRAAEELQKLRAELAHVTRVRTVEQLTASVAHEINQPIAAAVTNAQAALRWLAAQPPDLDEVREACRGIIENGRRAGDVIGRIRALIKKAPARKDRLDINEAVLDVIALARSEVLRRRVLLQTDLATDLPLIQGDRVQLQQVILNLILNALEAVSDIHQGAREALISTGRDGAHGIRVAVRDSGPGLDPRSADRVFEAFYTTKSDGMGMGLAICRSIIEAHGGRIWATANEPRGALFEFTLRPEQDNTVRAEHAGRVPAV
jgi:PAS domain S-box-containing protein